MKCDVNNSMGFLFVANISKGNGFALFNVIQKSINDVILYLIYIKITMDVMVFVLNEPIH